MELYNYTKIFLILEQVSSRILGNPFLAKNDIIDHHSKKLLKLPDLTLRINLLESHTKNLSSKNLETITETVLKLKQQEIKKKAISKA